MANYLDIQFREEPIFSVIILGRWSRALICRSFAHYLVDGFYHRELLDSQFYRSPVKICHTISHPTRDCVTKRKFHLHACCTRWIIFRPAGNFSLPAFHSRFRNVVSLVIRFDNEKNAKFNIPYNFCYIFWSTFIFIKILFSLFFLTWTINRRYNRHSNWCIVCVCTYLWEWSLKNIAVIIFQFNSTKYKITTYWSHFSINNFRSLDF